MFDDFLISVKSQLEAKGYALDANPLVPGSRGLLYASSPMITSVGPIKFKNHFLFVDWDNDHFGMLDKLLETQKNFSKFVNQEYKVPHAWRIKIPNLAVIALSDRSFSEEAVNCAVNKYFIPWQGGEVGQIMLLNLQSHEMIHHYKKTYKQTGSIPLGYAVSEIKEIFTHFFNT